MTDLKITNLDKAFLTFLRGGLIGVMDDVSKKFGVKIEVGRGTFDSQHATIKLEVSVFGEDGQPAHDPVRVAWDALHRLYDFHPDDLGREFVTAGVTYKIVGLKGTRPKYPVEAERVSDGKRFKFPVDQVKYGLRVLGTHMAGAFDGK